MSLAAGASIESHMELDFCFSRLLMRILEVRSTGRLLRVSMILVVETWPLPIFMLLLVILLLLLVFISDDTLASLLASASILSCCEFVIFSSDFLMVSIFTFRLSSMLLSR